MTFGLSGPVPFRELWFRRNSWKGSNLWGEVGHEACKGSRTAVSLTRWMQGHGATHLVHSCPFILNPFAKKKFDICEVYWPGHSLTPSNLLGPRKVLDLLLRHVFTHDRLSDVVVVRDNGVVQVVRALQVVDPTLFAITSITQGDPSVFPTLLCSQDRLWTNPLPVREKVESQKIFIRY